MVIITWSDFFDKGHNMSIWSSVWYKYCCHVAVSLTSYMSDCMCTIKWLVTTVGATGSLSSKTANRLLSSPFTSSQQWVYFLLFGTILNCLTAWYCVLSIVRYIIYYSCTICKVITDCFVAQWDSPLSPLMGVPSLDIEFSHCSELSRQLACLWMSS